MSSKAFSPSSISIKEAATRLGVHESTVRRYAPDHEETVDEVIDRVGVQPLDDLSTLARPDLWDDDENLERFLALNRELRDHDG